MTKSKVFPALLVLLLLLLPLLLKLQLWVPLQGEIYHFGRDFPRLMYPWLHSTAMLKQGADLPLYSPLEGFGRPLHTNLQSGAFYPGTTLVAWLFPEGIPLHAAEFYLLFHLSVAALGTYVLGRQQGLKPISAALSGLLFAGGGFFLTHVSILSMAASAAWTPWVLAACLAAVQRGGLWWSGAAGLAIALSVLGGLPQPAYYALLFTTLAAVWTAVSERTVRPLLTYGVIGILALGLAAPAVLPGAVDLPEMVRGGDWRWEMDAPHLLAARMVSPVLPHAAADAGLPVAHSWYIGVAALPLLLVGLLSGRLRDRRMIVAGLVLLLAVGMAAVLALDDLFGLIMPGYAFFKEHERVGVLLNLLAALLAGAGFSRIIGKEKQPAASWTALGILSAQVAVLLVFPGLRQGHLLLQSSIFIAAAAGLTVALFLLKGRQRQTVVGLIILVEVLCMGNINNLRPGVDEELERIQEVAAPIPRREGQPPPRVAMRWRRDRATLLAAWGYNTIYTGDTNLYRRLLRTWSMMEANHAVLGHFSTEWLITEGDQPQEERNPYPLRLDGNRPVWQTALPAGIERLDIVGAGDGAPGKIDAVARAADGRLIEGRGEDGELVLEAVDLPLTHLWVARSGMQNTAIADIRANGRRLLLPPAYEQVGPLLYKISDALPRLNLVSEVLTMPGEVRSQQAVKDGAPLEHLVVLEADEQLESRYWTAMQAAQAEVTMGDWDVGRIIARAEAPTACWLVFNEFYHRGWEAWVNGERQTVQRANYSAMAVPLPAGTHEIVLRFDDPLARTGMILRWVALLAVLALTVAGVVRRRGWNA